jgi:hypothetical protein
MRRSLVGETSQREKRGQIRLLDSTDHGRVPNRQTIMNFANARIVALKRFKVDDHCEPGNARRRE